MLLTVRRRGCIGKIFLLTELAHTQGLKDVYLCPQAAYWSYQEVLLFSLLSPQ